MIVLHLFLILFGLLWVPVCLGTVNGDFSGMFWLWGNDEEGCPDWWMDRAANSDHGKVAEWFPRFWWYAIRNPVNNFSFIFDDREAHTETDWNTDKPMEAQQLRNEGQHSAFMWSYNGPFGGYRRVWLTDSGKYSEVWIGWKVGSTVPGMGFTTQIRLKRDIGK